ncbi:MAG: type II toxin-antitoxin system VapC family toxin, partial [Angustibacter sp.]
TVTIVEAVHPGISRAALDGTLAKIVVIAVTDRIARQAAALCAQAGRHGHRHAIDAIVAATGLQQSGPVTLLTSDPGDFAAPCDDKIAIVRV